MKARLHGGPLSGKVIDNPPRGPDYDSIVVYGPKKMSREKLAEYMFNMKPHDPIRPMVQCLYRRARVTGFINNAVVDTPCIHPDGSVFYVYDRTLTEHPLRKT